MTPLIPLLLIGALVAAPHAGASSATRLDLPEMGASAQTVLSPEQERAIGERVMRQLRASLGLVEDPELTAYIQELGYRLASHSGSPAQDFTFFIVDAPSINAFALPGGFIGIHSGLILAADSESELAAVVAHEIAHVTQRHLARAFEAQSRMSLPAAAALIAAIVLAQQNPQLGEAAIATYAAGTAQLSINFTRHNEQEADRLGIQMLARAGFDPESMADFFERLHKASRLYGPQLPEFLSTHPVTATRIADARSRSAQYRREPRPDSQSFHLARARLEVVMGKDPRQAADHFRGRLQSGDRGQQEAARYGLALALLASGDPEAARPHIAQLKKDGEARIAYLLAEAELELAAGRAEQAMALFRDALRLYPGNRALTVRHAEALLAHGDGKAARDLLRRHLRFNSADPALLRLLGQAEAEAGFPAEAHQAMAEYHLLNGNVHAAVEQLTTALRLPDLDFFQSSRIRARLDELSAEGVAPAP